MDNYIISQGNCKDLVCIFIKNAMFILKKNVILKTCKTLVCLLVRTIQGKINLLNNICTSYLNIRRLKGQKYSIKWLQKNLKQSMIHGIKTFKHQCLKYRGTKHVWDNK